MSQDEFIRTALRVPPDLHKALHEASDNAARSFNAEIIDRLQKSFAPEEQSALTALRYENELLKEMLKGRTLGTDLAAILAVALAGQTLGMIASLPQAKQKEREVASLQSFADLVIQKQPGDLAREVLKAFSAPVDPVGARARRELEVLARIAQSYQRIQELQSKEDSSQSAP